MDLSEEQKSKIQEWYPNATFQKYEAKPNPQNPGSVFPHDARYFPDWTIDNFGPIVLPEGKYFFMGDNRDNSYDSRYRGFVDQEDIEGTLLFQF